MLTLSLCAPYSYYPIVIVIFMASLVILYIIRKYMLPAKKVFIPSSILLFILGYTLCTYIVFKPTAYTNPSDFLPDPNKKAVIFYCQGEMEKYTPYYANHFIGDQPILLKPIKTNKIKGYYKEMGVNEKNRYLSSIASSLKISMMQKGPYYFYIAFSGYIPDFNDSIKQAIKDGCSEITVINYTPMISIEEALTKSIDMEYLKEKNIKIKFTKSVCKAPEFLTPFVDKVKTLPTKADGILIIDSTMYLGDDLKKSLMGVGYKNDEILISEDISSSMQYFINKGYNSVLYIDLRESGAGLTADVIVPRLVLPYSNRLKISGIKSWGYHENYIKACIKVFIEVEE